MKILEDGVVDVDVDLRVRLLLLVVLLRSNSRTNLALGGNISAESWWSRLA